MASPATLRTDNRVVIAGGGAGGLVLAVRLARKRLATVILVDPEPVHLWKPLLHELASGSLEAATHAIPYLALARRHGFTFAQGALEGLDRQACEIRVSAVAGPDGSVAIPPRTLPYDHLVLAVGATTNDFGIAGVRRHTRMLDTATDAEAIRARIVSASMAANFAAVPDPAARFRIVIVGGGATGVELAAELRSTARTLASYGLDRLDPDRFIEITILNADPRLLPQLPEDLAADVAGTLADLGVAVRNGETVVEVGERSLVTRGGGRIEADLAIWVAGVKGPDISARLDGLETTARGLLAVTPELRTTRDPHISAIGDCAACPWVGHQSLVPARAQAGHQEAEHLARHMKAVLEGRPIPPFRYNDLGSLVSLGSGGSAIGTLMGFVTGGRFRVEGLLAGLFYRWLYRRHRAALFGWPAVALESVGLWLGGATRPRIKLH